MANFISPVPGSNLKNEDLILHFLCSPQGGMRRSNRTNTLVIVSNHVASIYDDRWVEDVLHYTGMGQVGDQSLAFNQNRTLNESRINGVAVHLFEVFTAKTYTYIGEVMLADEPYQERQPDVEGQDRFVWVFPLRLKSGTPPAISDVTLQQLNRVKEKQARKLSDAEVEALARRQGRVNVGKRSARVTQHQRSPWVAEHAKRRSKGRCDLCQEASPFNRKDGTPYLETHHIEWLVHGGADTVENTVALCPNCHRKMHVLDDQADQILLVARINSHLLKELCVDEEISFEHEGAKYSGTYSVHGDELIVYLPDGSQRATTLRGLDPEVTALTHLRGFVLHSKNVDRTGN